MTLPNPAFEPSASALRLLAVPSSLRSSAAAQARRWVASMRTLLLGVAVSFLSTSYALSADLYRRDGNQVNPGARTW